MIIKNDKLGSANNNYGGPMITFWGQSTVSSDDAINQAVAAASKALPGATFHWLELLEIRGGFENNQLAYQVAVRIGYVA